jgi:hypothetical protein
LYSRCTDFSAGRPNGLPKIVVEPIVSVFLSLERAKGIEPSYAAWEAAVLPLNYARISMRSFNLLNQPVLRGTVFGTPIWGGVLATVRANRIAFCNLGCDRQNGRGGWQSARAATATASAIVFIVTAWAKPRTASPAIIVVAQKTGTTRMEDVPAQQ